MSPLTEPPGEPPDERSPRVTEPDRPGGSRAVPVEDGSRVEAEVAGALHERLDAAEHTVGGHPADPAAGVVRATPPDAGALLVAAAVAALTLLALVLTALKVS